jgi:uncharacterized protein YdaU (DUF1376 family)
MNFYPFHIGDYVTATRHLSWEEDCAYRRLLDTYYVTEKPIPLDIRQACRLVMATTESQREAVEVVLKEFFIETAIGWVSHRADEEIDRMRASKEKQREKANKRWQYQKQEHGTAPAMPEHKEVNAAASESNADAMPPIPIPIPIPMSTTDVVDKKKRAPRFDACRHLISLGVPEAIAADWVSLRRQKKAPPTATAIEGIAVEAGKAGMTLTDALATCCSRGWQGFKASWLDGGQRAPTRVSASDSRSRAIDELTGRSREGGREIDITGEVVRLATAVGGADFQQDDGQLRLAVR